MIIKSLLTGLLATTTLYTSAAAHDVTKLLRDPALSENHITYVYAGDIWVADRDGTNSRRLTSSPSEESSPTFSPDGSLIAYTGRYENNDDVYIIPTSGGQPTRLTWHPGADTVLDWAPNGNDVVFVSRRETNHGRSQQLYHVSVDGGLPEKQMKARVFRGKYDNSGDNFAFISYSSGYNGLFGGSSGWRGYRGGATPSIQIMDMRNNEVTYVEGDGVNDIEPLWVGEDLYFISDRDDKTLNLFKFHSENKKIERVSSESKWDIRAAETHGDDIIFERGGLLHLFDTKAGTEDILDISISPDLPQLRPQWKDASKTLESFNISPNGKRMVVTARGDVFTVPTKDGTTRNLSQSTTHDYTALWSPDGQNLAYVDAAETKQVLVIKDQKGLKAPKTFKLDDNFNFLLEWGGQGEQIAYVNNKLELSVINIASGKRDKISTGARRSNTQVDMSPDGRWLAYTQEQSNFNRDLYLYDFTRKKSVLISDGMADISTPAFSPDGKYLYFAASTNSGPQQVGLDLSSREKPYRAAIYAAVLSEDEKSPMHKAMGDEEPKKEGDKSKDDDKTEKPVTKIDLEGLSDRIVALPIAKDNYSHIKIAKDGTLYAIANVQAGAQVTPPGERNADSNNLIRYNFADRKLETVMSGVTNLDMSENGEHMGIQMANSSLKFAKLSEKIDAETLKMSDVKMKITPREEWAAIFDETWRMQQAYFYDPNMHGLEWDEVYERYRPLVDHVGRREDLTDLLVEMIGEMQVGHNRTGGGDIHRDEGANTGLLGADLIMENGRHKLVKIYSGENWNPYISSPLAGPGIDINEGDYILSVNGHDLGAKENIFEHLQGRSGQQITLEVSNFSSGKDSREVVIEPTSSENNMRLWNWVESNRKYVDEATNGKVGYVFLPNTAGAGFTFFNRMFFSQVDKDAMIFDERSNGGGHAANYITDILSRKYLAGWKDSVGMVYNTPGGAMFGPKVMLIDQDAGSGGDFLPYSFREHELGPLIGTRTWGGLIGISANPPLIDGGFLSVPNFRFFDVNYDWTIENEGTAPDIELILDSTKTNEGIDTQLDRAIEEITDALANFKAVVPTKAPPYPIEVGK